MSPPVSRRRFLKAAGAASLAVAGCAGAAGRSGAGRPPNIVLDGFDMTGVLAGKRESPRTEMFWKRRGDVAARVGNWKWVESAGGSGLFDLSSDLGEQNDLAAARPDVLRRLKTRFAAWQKHMADAEPRRPFRDF